MLSKYVSNRRWSPQRSLAIISGDSTLPTLTPEPARGTGALARSSIRNRHSSSSTKYSPPTFTSKKSPNHVMAEPAVSIVFTAPSSSCPGLGYSTRATGLASRCRTRSSPAALPFATASSTTAFGNVPHSLSTISNSPWPLCACLGYGWSRCVRGMPYGRHRRPPAICLSPLPPGSDTCNVNVVALALVTSSVNGHVALAPGARSITVAALACKCMPLPSETTLTPTLAQDSPFT